MEEVVVLFFLSGGGGSSPFFFLSGGGGNIPFDETELAYIIIQKYFYIPQVWNHFVCFEKKDSHFFQIMNLHLKHCYSLAFRHQKTFVSKN